MKNKKLVTFVIPSVARKTLIASINSLYEQKSDNWQAIVGFDGLLKEEIELDLPKDEDRIKYLFLEKTGELKNKNAKHSKAGFARNKIIKNVETEWTAFLDDDDTISEDYVSILEEQIQQNESTCYVFQMKAIDGNVMPFTGSKRIIIGQVGISFCVKTSFLKENNILFNNSQSEDYEMLKNIASNGGKIKLIEHVGYIVGR